MKLTNAWARDTGLIAAFIFVLLGTRGSGIYLVLASVFILMALLAPILLYPLGYVWLLIAKIFNAILPKFFFSIIFYLIVTPIGLIRRLIHKDEHGLSSWKTSKSTFKERNHEFSKSDLENVF